MPTSNKVWYLNSLRNRYTNALKTRKKLNTHTTDEYNRLIRLATNALGVAGLQQTPTKIGEPEIDYLQNELYCDLAPTTNRRQISIIGQYLHYYGNDIVQRMMIPWPNSTRPNAKWLTDEEGVMMLDAARTPMQKMVIHLELRLLMRRCEVIRLTRQDVQFGLLHVLGKGRMGGKWRTLAWAPETQEVIQEYSDWREELIAKALDKSPDQEIPDQIAVYAQYGWKLGAYQETAIDTIVKEVAIQAGIDPEDVSNHVLRRTGTRIHHHTKKVPMPELMAALGHVSEGQTMQYAGLNVDDLSEMQFAVTDYLAELRRKMAGQSYNERPICRPQLIAR